MKTLYIEKQTRSETITVQKLYTRSETNPFREATHRVFKKKHQ